MKFSIITPTHIKNSFLMELYESLLEQTYTDWEWVIYLNGGATPNQVEKKIQEDKRVKLFVSPYEKNTVGGNKHEAFNLGTGDVLVEVDHDDMLTPDCLEELNKAYQDDSVGFAFSDAGYYHVKDEFKPFGTAWGWTYKMFNWKGKDLYSMDSFEVNSRSLSFIWYSPDHVRSWRNSVYKSLGGHDKTLDVCDDQDLMTRTYIAGHKMYQINKVLYIYRITGENTWLEKNAAIQTKTRELFHKYGWDLAVRDAKDKGLLIVDVGGGLFPKPGCMTIDQQDADINCDLNDGIPLPDNSVGVLNASHVIEHLHDKTKIMSEIHRVLADGGWAFIEVPSTDGRGAWQDPTHVSFWNENSFWYYIWRDKAQFIRNTTIRFQEFRLQTLWGDNHIATTIAWLTAIKSDKKRPHLTAI